MLVPSLSLGSGSGLSTDDAVMALGVVEHELEGEMCVPTARIPEPYYRLGAILVFLSHEWDLGILLLYIALVDTYRIHLESALESRSCFKARLKFLPRRNCASLT